VGLYSCFIFDNLTSLVVINFLLIIGILIYLLIKFAVHKCMDDPESNNSEEEMENLEDHQKTQWSSFYLLILFLKLFFLPLLLFSIINLSCGDLTSSGYNIFNMLVALGYTLVIFSFFLFCLIVLLKHQHQLFLLKRKFGFIFAECKVFFMAYSYVVLFLLTKIIVAFVIALMTEKPVT